MVSKYINEKSQTKTLTRFSQNIFFLIGSGDCKKTIRQNSLKLIQIIKHYLENFLVIAGSTETYFERISYFLKFWTIFKIHQILN